VKTVHSNPTLVSDNVPKEHHLTELIKTCSTMPLQKSSPCGPPTADPQMAKRKQLQERRRTLQTISELSATEATPPELSTLFANDQVRLTTTSGTPNNMGKPSNLNKRRSLPQYCARPECIQTRSSPLAPSMHVAGAQRPPSGDEIQASPPPRQEAGWNARRERARLQAEQALSGTPLRHEPTDKSLQTGSSTSVASSLPRAKTSQPHLKSYHSQRTLLDNNRSTAGTTSRSERSSGRHKDAWDIESSGRASTDSSSFHSSHDSSMRRSPSSSSSQSFTIQGVPPLPTGCAPPTQLYYSTLTSHYQNGYPFQLPGPMYAKAPSEMRGSVLPFVSVEHAKTPLLGGYLGTSPELPHKWHHGNGNKQRPKSLSARSTSSHQQRYNKHTSQASMPPQRSRHSSQSTLPPTGTQKRSHSHTRSNLKSPATAHLPNRRAEAMSVTFDQGHTQRALPDRESLIKWKAEREEAKAEFGAKMKERVRRANEMEQEKEKELQAVGKGAEKGARVLGIGLEKERGRGKGRGCFGVLVSWWRG
jgi:hypothetical protein